MSNHEAWVNGNPDPDVHAYGATLGRRQVVVGLCRITVRREVGRFDPSDPRSCVDCARFVRDGLTWDDVKDRTTVFGPGTIVCRRPA